MPPQPGRVVVILLAAALLVENVVPVPKWASTHARAAIAQDEMHGNSAPSSSGACWAPVIRAGSGRLFAGARAGSGRGACCARRALWLLRMDAGDNSMGERVEAKRRTRFAPGPVQEDAHSPQPDLIGGGLPAVPKIYNWSALGLSLDGEPAGVLKMPAPAKAATADESRKPDAADIRLEQQLQAQLESLQAEHRDINEISDRLGQQEMGGAGAIHLVSQRAALKKRKLMLKDQMLSIQSQLAELRAAEAEVDVLPQGLEYDAEESEESEESNDDLAEPDTQQESTEKLTARLRELGLRPDSVPPHKDSFFLALMKGLQLAGLRPRQYDFRESAVMGSTSQFPWAAKRARQDVMALLSSQVHRLKSPTKNPSHLPKIALIPANRALTETPARCRCTSSTASAGGACRPPSSSATSPPRGGTCPRHATTSSWHPLTYTPSVSSACQSSSRMGCMTWWRRSSTRPFARRRARPSPSAAAGRT
jgi:hypothetical protein